MAPLLQVATRDGHGSGHTVAASPGGAAAPVAPSGGATGSHTGTPATRGRNPLSGMVTVAGRLAGRLGTLRTVTSSQITGRSNEPVAAVPAGGRADWASDLATLAIVVTAGVASWAGWVYLAEAVGWGTVSLFGAGFRLSWLLPLSVDVYAFVAARAWLGRGLDADTKGWGRGSAWGALGLSMIGNAGGHAVEAGVWTPNWVAIVIVAIIPPAMLFLALHLRTMRTRDREAMANRQAVRLTKRVAQQATSSASRTDAAPANGQLTPAGTPATMTAARPMATSRPASDTADRVRAAYEAAVADGRAGAMTATELAVTIGAEIGSSARTVRRYLTRLRNQPAATDSTDEVRMADGHREGHQVGGGHR